jgi:hypothetical protein
MLSPSATIRGRLSTAGFDALPEGESAARPARGASIPAGAVSRALLPDPHAAVARNIAATAQTSDVESDDRIGLETALESHVE